MATDQTSPETQDAALYGSDLMAEVLKKLGVKYLALNPGATLRGLHDSVVNHLSNREPSLVQVLHENVAVAAAHGFAKASGEVMAVGLHNVVGLLSGSMSVFNSWCDHEPILILGATGPGAVERRRPGIDWVHTALVQGNLVRDFVKWDDQPSSLPSVVESLTRAHKIARTEPQGPVYVCLDAGLQEDPLSVGALNHHLQDVGRSRFNRTLQADGDSITEISTALREADFPVFLVDRVGRTEEAFWALSRLADRWGIAVVEAERKSRLNIATNHEMNISGAAREALMRADVIVALDVKDLLGPLSDTDPIARRATPFIRRDARIFAIGLDELSARGWLSDYQSLFPVELGVMADTTLALPTLDQEMGPPGDHVQKRRHHIAQWHSRLRRGWMRQADAPYGRGGIARSHLARAVATAVHESPFVIAHGELRGWTRRLFDLDRPRQHLGATGGAGLGYGLGATLGAALAHRDTDTLIVNLQSDGDAMYTPSALWSFAHHDLAALVVVDNNRSYGQDENHQAMMASSRSRNVEKSSIGTRLDRPAIGFADLALSMGVYGMGPVKDASALSGTLQKAVELVRSGQTVVVDVHTEGVPPPPTNSSPVSG